MPSDGKKPTLGPKQLSTRKPRRHSSCHVKTAEFYLHYPYLVQAEYMGRTACVMDIVMGLYIKVRALWRGLLKLTFVT